MEIAFREMELSAPITQTVEAVKGLLAWIGRASDPLPSFVEMGQGENRLVLVLSNKKDAYYTTTSRACSCPSNTYRSGPCKHMRKHFPSAPEKTIMQEGSLLAAVHAQPFKPFLEAV